MWSTTRAAFSLFPVLSLPYLRPPLSLYSSAFRKLKRACDEHDTATAAAAVATRGRIVERCTSGQLALAFATNLYLLASLPFSISLFLIAESNDRSVASRSFSI